MLPLSALSVTLLLGFATSVRGLECNEGFNMTIGGIPLYHWMERTCTGDSKCFGQELQGTYGVPVVLRYGACLTAAYDSYLDCENLFGATSNFDPALLLDLIPEITERVSDTVNDFVTDTAKQLTILLSNGQGSMEFVDGIFTFYETLGINMTKALPLKQPLADLLSVAFTGNSATIQQAVAEFFNAIANLDTVNQEYTDGIYNLINNVDRSGNIALHIRTDTILSPLVERVPGLIRSMLPGSYFPGLWYDVTFMLLNKLNITMPKQTAEDMLAIINATYDIPAELRPYTDLFFERIPDLVDQMAKGNFAYAGNWSLNVLMEVSEVNNATTAFSDALTNFLETIIGQTLQYEFKMTIKLMPGLFYKFFPSDTSEIDEVYNKITEGLKSFDFTNITNTAEPTDLSDLLISLVEANTGTALDGFSRALIINFSRMFYNLLSDYTSYVEKFFSILKSSLSKWPSINAGQLIGDLVVGLNGTVPLEIKPLLENLQPIITEVTKAATGLDVLALFDAMKAMIDAYKVAYPDSEFPVIMESFLNYTRSLIFFDPLQPNAAAEYEKLINEVSLLSIDLQFAIMNSINYTTDEFTQMIIQSFPAYGTYIDLFQLLDPDDIKQLVRDITTWITGGGPYTSEGFVDAVKQTTQKITGSINSLLGEIRAIFKPESCKYSSCDTDLCNSHVFIGSQSGGSSATITNAVDVTHGGAVDVTHAGAVDVTRTSAEGATPSTTTSAGELVTANLLLNLATLWIFFKAAF